MPPKAYQHPLFAAAAPAVPPVAAPVPTPIAESKDVLPNYAAIEAQQQAAAEARNATRRCPGAPRRGHR